MPAAYLGGGMTDHSDFVLDRITKEDNFFRQNNIKTFFFDIRLATPAVYLGGKKTDFRI